MSKFIDTRAGRVAVDDSETEGDVLLMLHGNSGSSAVFSHQVNEFSQDLRVVSVDYPGHGASDDAVQPERDYTLAGYANAIGDALDALGARRVFAVGVSLGGHIALELAAGRGIAALMLVGSPPFAKSVDSIGQAFMPGPGLTLSGKPDLSPEDIETFLTLVHPGGVEEFAAGRAALQRTDGRARAIMVANLFAAEARDQLQLAETLDLPIAVVNGAADNVVNLDYLEAVPYRHLWRGRGFRIAGAVHSPQSSHPGAFNALLREFLSEVREGRV